MGDVDNETAGGALTEPTCSQSVTARPWDEDALAAVSFVGRTLGPLFLYAPHDARCRPVLRALAELDPVAAGAEWPFAGDGASAHLDDLARDAASEVALWPEELEDELSRSCEPTDGERDGGKTASPKLPDTDLQRHYRTLFAGPGHLDAPPWGSVYTDRECVVFGLTTLDLRAWMRTNGVRIELDEKVPEDHMGLMLAQMAWLADNRSDLLDDFLRLHLLTWSSHYLNLLAEVADKVGARFYRGLAGLTRATLEGIKSARQLQVDVPRFYR